MNAVLTGFPGKLLLPDNKGIDSKLSALSRSKITFALFALLPKIMSK